MARKKNRKPSQHITKAVKSTTTEQRASKTQISSAAIEAIKRTVDIWRPIELSDANRLRTFNAMLRDDAIYSGVSTRRMAVEKAISKGVVKYNTADKSGESLKAKNFIDYVFSNLENQTMRSIGWDASSMLENGWSPFEFVSERINDDFSEFDGMFRLKKLAFVNPLTLDQTKPFYVEGDGNIIKYLRQDSSAFTGTDGRRAYGMNNFAGIKKISWNRIVYTTYGAYSSTSPIGLSPLEAAYTLWREKTLLQEYALIGVTKDFAGTPVLYLPEDLLADAAADPSGKAAKMVEQLKDAMANMHAGDQSYVVLPSDVQETSTSIRQFEMKFQGIDGGGRGFDITEIIEQRRKALFVVLSTQSLIVGENGGGSYNLHEGQANAQAHVVERDCMIIDEMINKHIIQKLLRLNNWKLSVENIPRWEHGEVSPVSISEASQAVSRTQNYLPMIPSVVNRILEINGIDYRVPDDMSTEELYELFPQGLNSVAGQDNGSSSGTGTTAQDNSDQNTENAA